MMIFRFVTFMACMASVHAQTPVDRAWTVLSDAAKDKSFEKREKAIQSLGVISNNIRARTMAETALADEREEVRATAAEALGTMRAKESVPKLKAAIRDKDASVVFAAANALALLGDRAAFEVYYAVLTGEKKSGDALVESQMKLLKDPKALSRVGLEVGVGFIPFGGVSYKAFKMVTADTVSPVRAAAAGRLINDPDPKSRRALSDSTKDEKWLVRAAAVCALARQNDPAALTVITPLLVDENEVVRFNSAAAVIHLSSARNAPAPRKK